jgi:hypothetical protein
MTVAEGRFRRIHDGVPHCAIVEATVVPTAAETSITVECKGNGWERQGWLEDASAIGYEDWKAGATRGVQFALEIAQRTAKVTISRITGMITDTNPSTVCGAAAHAVWNALSYSPDDSVVVTMDEVVFRGWKRSPGDVPTIEELHGISKNSG